MNTAKLRINVCDCGLHGGDVHIYLWANEVKHGPYFRSYEVILKVIEYAIIGSISFDEALEAGTTALGYLSSSFDGELAAPARELLSYVKERVRNENGRKLADEIFSEAIAEEDVLAKMFEEEEPPTTRRVFV